MVGALGLEAIASLQVFLGLLKNLKAKPFFCFHLLPSNSWFGDLKNKVTLLSLVDILLLREATYRNMEQSFFVGIILLNRMVSSF